MESEHIVKSFDADLGQIESLLLEMGGLAETQIGEAVKALIERDAELGEKIRADDRRVDEMEVRVDELAIRLLALRQPMAEDLRSVIAALKIASSLERIGDYAKNIAKRASALAESPQTNADAGTIKRMSKVVRDMVRDVLDSYVARDSRMAEDVRRRDEEVDRLHNTLFRELLTYMMEDARNIPPCLHLLFAAKNIERMGDHATGIAEQVHYLVTGTQLDDDRPKVDMPSFMSTDGEADGETARGDSDR